MPNYSVFHRTGVRFQASWKRVAVGTVFLLMSSIWGAVFAHNNDDRLLNIWPLFYYEGNGKSGTERWELLWPFISFEGNREGHGYALRPLFSVKEERDDALYEILFLWPFGWYKRTPEKKKFRLFPVYYYNKYTPNDGGEESDYKLIPIIFGGRSEEDSYFALFPLGGKLNHWLGKDRIRFFLFPLYADSIKDDSRSWYVLWPIFSFAEGEGSKAYRFWPLFGHGYKVGEYSKDFILWPIFNFQRTGLDTDNPSEVLMILPFYACQKSPRKHITSILWPFFSYTDNRQQNYQEWHLPWPVFSWTRGQDREGNKLWPLWGYQRKGGSERFYSFWPLYWSMRETSENFEKKKNIIFPLYKRERRTWKEGNKSADYIRFWPLFSYERKEDDTLKLSFLSPLWFREGDGFRRNYSPFWTLYEYRRDSEGNQFSRGLWRLYRHDKTKSSDSWELIHLVSYQKEGREKTSFSLLRGLFGYKREKGKKTLRFLYFLKFPLAL